MRVFFFQNYVICAPIMRTAMKACFAQSIRMPQDLMDSIEIKINHQFAYATLKKAGGKIRKITTAMVSIIL